MDQLTQQIVNRALSRRGFLAGAGVATAATLAGCGNSSTTTPIQPTTPTANSVSDVDVLNFALNLEYLEATYYLLGATGTGIPSTDQLSGAGTVTAISSPAVQFSTPLTRGIAAELAQTELQHVRAIQATIKALGGTPVAAPAIDLTNGFNGAASAAGVGSSFNPFANEVNFFIGALTFEEVGVSAYTGAASLISNATVLSAAAGIQAAEAYHAGALRTYLISNYLATGSAAALQSYVMIQKLRATLGGGGETPIATVNSSGAISTSTSNGVYTVVNADTTNSIAQPRTVNQVLNIVYAKSGSGVSSGGFFPSGLNGNIKTS